MATILLAVPILCLFFFQLENLFESMTVTLIAYAVLAGLFLSMIFLALHCWSVAAICLVRQPIYAAVLSMASVLMVPGVVYAFHHLQLSQGWDEAVMLTALCIFLSVLGTLTAWLAVRYDIGYKS